jgi:hypothetical protein
MKFVSDQLFTFDGTAAPTVTHERCPAADLGLKESWGQVARETWELERNFERI